MACTSPIDAWLLGGQVFFKASSGGRYVRLPCGQCMSCRLKRSVDWATRILHESQLYESNVFVTLTYREDDLPQDGSLRYRDFQLFMKRLRWRLGAIRFFMCGEYGDVSWRPHFHACLFGVDFADRVHWRNSSAGFPLFRSSVLDRAWRLGNAEFGDVTFESAAYVARYCCKKITGDRAAEHYQRVSPVTGEIVNLEPEFSQGSRDPPLGVRWFQRFAADVLPHDFCVVAGRKVPVPRAYDRILDADFLEALKNSRILKAVKFASEQTYDRMRVRDAVTRARMSFNSRNLEM